MTTFANESLPSTAWVTNPDDLLLESADSLLAEDAAYLSLEFDADGVATTPSTAWSNTAL
jgi:hypothetical protein